MLHLYTYAGAFLLYYLKQKGFNICRKSKYCMISSYADVLELFTPKPYNITL